MLDGLLIFLCSTSCLNSPLSPRSIKRLCTLFLTKFPCNFGKYLNYLTNVFSKSIVMLSLTITLSTIPLILLINIFSSELISVLLTSSSEAFTIRSISEIQLRLNWLDELDLDRLWLTGRGVAKQILATL